MYTLFRNRAHSNVAFMMNEDMRYQPELDTITLYPGVLTSYPNFMFHLRTEDIDDFVKQMNAVEDGDDFAILVTRFGVRRTTQVLGVFPPSPLYGSQNHPGGRAGHEPLQEPVAAVSTTLPPILGAVVRWKRWFHKDCGMLPPGRMASGVVHPIS